MAELAPGFLSLTEVLQRRVTDVSVDVIRSAVEQSTTAYSAAFNNLIAALVEDIPDYNKFQERYRMPSTGTLQALDEYGRPKPTTEHLYYTQAYPLEHAGAAWGGTWLAMAKMTVQEANDEVMRVHREDADWNIRRILASLFFPSTWTFPDAGKGDLTIKPLAYGNADEKFTPRNGVPITFNAYRAQADAIDATHNPFPALVRDLRQFPGNTGKIVTYINNDQRASIEALPGFVAVGDPDITPGVTSDRLGTPPPHLGDEMCGKVNGSWIAEWARIPSGYLLTVVSGIKPVARRQEPENALQGFIVKPVIQEGVMHTYEYYRRVGYAPRNRVSAVVTRVGNAVYAAPAEFASLPLPA